MLIVLLVRAQSPIVSHLRCCSAGPLQTACCWYIAHYCSIYMHDYLVQASIKQQWRHFLPSEPVFSCLSWETVESLWIINMLTYSIAWLSCACMNAGISGYWTHFLWSVMAIYLLTPSSWKSWVQFRATMDRHMLKGACMLIYDIIEQPLVVRSSTSHKSNLISGMIVIHCWSWLQRTTTTLEDYLSCLRHC